MWNRSLHDKQLITDQSCPIRRFQQSLIHSNSNRQNIKQNKAKFLFIRKNKTEIEQLADKIQLLNQINFERINKKLNKVQASIKKQSSTRPFPVEYSPPLIYSHPLHVHLPSLVPQPPFVSYSPQNSRGNSLPLIHDYPHHILQNNDNQLGSTVTSKNIIQKNRYKFKSKLQKKYHNSLNRKKLIICFKKVVICIQFIHRISKLSYKIKIHRNKITHQLWPKFSKYIKAVLQIMYNGSKGYLNMVYLKRQTQITITGYQSHNLRKEKQNCIQEMFDVLISGIILKVNSTQFSDVIKLLHTYCRHGALVKHPFLTRAQLRYVCVLNDSLLLDWPLQQIQIINFLFVKLLTFNILFQPWKRDTNFQQPDQTLSANINYLSSLFYHICMSLIRDLLKQHQSHLNNSYTLANANNIPLAKSLCLSKSNPKQVISGALGSQIIKYISNSTKDTFQSLINVIHNRLCQYHRSLIDSIL